MGSTLEHQEQLRQLADTVADLCDATRATLDAAGVVAYSADGDRGLKPAERVALLVAERDGAVARNAVLTKQLNSVWAERHPAKKAPSTETFGFDVTVVTARLNGAAIVTANGSTNRDAPNSAMSADCIVEMVKLAGAKIVRVLTVTVEVPLSYFEPAPLESLGTVVATEESGE